MIAAIRLLLLALIATALVGGTAQAHTRSESHSSWIVDGRIVRASVTFPDLEAKRLDPAGRRPSDAAIVRYLVPKVGATAGAENCPAASAPHMVAAATGFRRAELIFDCPGTEDIALRFSAFFELVATHVDLAQIQFANGDFVEQLFTANGQTLDLVASQGGRLQDAGFLRFVQMGIMHIFTGVDHMSFLVGLVLISRRLRDLIFVVTGFTIGHSLTLGLAVSGIIRPHAEFIDALVALTIALIGIENIVVSLRKPMPLAIATAAFLSVMALLSLANIGVLPALLLLGAALFTGCYLIVSGYLQDTGRLRMVVTMVFGLIHGFGFASDLLESRLPKEKLAEILVGFNLGVEIGQLTVVLAITALVVAARRLRLAPPRAITVDVTASVLVIVGMHWFIERSFA